MALWCTQRRRSGRRVDIDVDISDSDDCLLADDADSDCGSLGVNR